MIAACMCAQALEHGTGADYSAIVSAGIGALVLVLYLFGCCYHLLQRRSSHRYARKVQRVREAGHAARRHMDRTSQEFVNEVQQQERN